MHQFSALDLIYPIVAVNMEEALQKTLARKDAMGSVVVPPEIVMCDGQPLKEVRLPGEEWQAKEQMRTKSPSLFRKVAKSL
jgi:hypothetical protein